MSRSGVGLPSYSFGTVATNARRLLISGGKPQGAISPRQKLSRATLQLALVGLACQHLSVSHIAECLAVLRNTANFAVLAEGHRLSINDLARLDGIKVIGVNESFVEVFGIACACTG